MDTKPISTIEEAEHKLELYLLALQNVAQAEAHLTECKEKADDLKADLFSVIINNRKEVEFWPKDNKESTTVTASQERILKLMRAQEDKKLWSDREISESFGKSSVYPTLQSMCKKGHLRKQGKHYSITPAGKMQI